MKPWDPPEERLYYRELAADLGYDVSSVAMQLRGMVDRPDLVFPSFTPSLPEALRETPNYFQILAERDILLHHPYQPPDSWEAVPPGVFKASTVIFPDSARAPIL